MAGARTVADSVLTRDSVSDTLENSNSDSNESERTSLDVVASASVKIKASAQVSVVPVHMCPNDHSSTCSSALRTSSPSETLC